MSPVLDEDAVKAISGGYERPADQVKALRRLGFFRARLGRHGRTVLEVPHYEAVCRGVVASSNEQPRPKLRQRRST